MHLNDGKAGAAKLSPRSHSTYGHIPLATEPPIPQSESQL